MTKRQWAFLSVFTATVIYGMAYSIAKDVMPEFIKPSGFILVRVLGATIFFWIMSLFTPKEKVERKDFFKIALCAVFGIALNMLTFFKGLSYTTPINSAVIMIIVPILVLIISSFKLKERITTIKIIGIFLGLIGALILTVYGKSDPVNGVNVPWGNFLTLINACSYAYYLVIVGSLLEKYNAFTFIKWFYLFGLVYVFPFGIQEFIEVNWAAMPDYIVWEVIFIVICSTVMTYLFNLLGLKVISASSMSVFIYLQPVIATLFALFLGKDYIDSVKVIASVLIFGGVYLATRKRKVMVNG